MKPILTAAGWTNVVVQRKANFIAISGDDPAGVNHSGAMTDGQALADFLISIGIKPPFRRTTAQAVPNVRHTRAAVATAPAEDTDLVKSLRARISELESRPPEIREVEKIVERVVEAPAAPIPLPPEPETTRLSDYGEVGDPADEITPDDLLNDMRRNGDGVRDVIAKLTSEKRRRFTELLNVELAELQQVRGRAGEDLKREAEIEKLLGLFARVGEI